MFFTRKKSLVFSFSLTVWSEMISVDAAGVPRIFIDEENADIGALESELSHENGDFIAEYIKTSRININIRQVF